MMKHAFHFLIIVSMIEIGNKTWKINYKYETNMFSRNKIDSYLFNNKP
jgi:hypothetical protein